MADLPMAQIPNFQLHGPENIPQPGGPWGQLASGVGQGIELGQRQQQIKQEQQKMEIEKNMKMLETGSNMILQGGPNTQPIGQSLIQKAYPFLTGGQQLPQGMPVTKDVAKDLGYFMDQHRLWQQSNGKEGLSAQDAVTGAIQAIAPYGKAWQDQQMGILEKTPMYKEGMANQVGGQVNGQPASKNEFTGEVQSPSGQSMSGAQGSFLDAGQAATMKQGVETTLGTHFADMSKDDKEVLDNGTQFMSMISPRLPSNPTEEQKAEFVMHDKAAIVKYIQMQIPASRRVNMSFDDMVKSDLVTAQVKSAWNKVAVQGTPLTNSDREALLKMGAKTMLNSEKTISSNEIGTASRASSNNADPLKTLTPLRPKNLPSTSKFFPSKGVGALSAQVGDIVSSPTGMKIYRGGDKADPKNWTPLE